MHHAADDSGITLSRRALRLLACSCLAAACVMLLSACSGASETQTENEFIAQHEADVLGSSTSASSDVQSGNIFEFTGDQGTIDFAKSFATDMPESLEFAYSSSTKTAQARFTDESTMTAVFAALSKADVGSATTVPSDAAHWTFTFTMPDGTTHTFAFVDGCLSQGGKFYSTSQTASLDVYVEDFAAL